jgi:hypothetical protein
MAKWYEAANQASFKPTDDGYIFQSPNPWIFGWPRYYLVSEAQRAAILPYLGRWRLLLLISVLAEVALLGLLIAFLNLAPAAFLRLVAPAFHFGIGIFAVGMFVLLMVLLAPLIAIPQIYLNRRLAPLLAGVPRTEQRIALGDQLPNIARSMSGKVLALGLVGGVCLMGAAIAGLIEAHSEGRWMNGLWFPFLAPFAMGAAVTSYFLYLLRLRSKQRREAAAKIDVN